MQVNNGNESDNMRRIEKQSNSIQFSLLFPFSGDYSIYLLLLHLFKNLLIFYLTTTILYFKNRHIN